MARIAGVNLPAQKKIKVSLTYIYGIGKTTAAKVLKKVKVDPEKLTKDLTDEEVNKLQHEVQEYRIEGELRRARREDIARLRTTGTYRGLRHRRGLPVRGQKTRTNARTRKGRKK